MGRVPPDVVVAVGFRDEDLTYTDVVNYVVSVWVSELSAYESSDREIAPGETFTLIKENSSSLSSTSLWSEGENNCEHVHCASW